MLYWQGEAGGGTGVVVGALWTQENGREREKGVRGGGVKSLLCMCAIQQDGHWRGGVHNSLISVRVFSLEPLFCHEEEEEEEVAACWLTPCAAALWATVLPVSRRPAFGGAVNSPLFAAHPWRRLAHGEL